MKFNSGFSKSIVLAMALVAVSCSGGKGAGEGGTDSAAKTEASGEVSIEQQLRDANAKYAAIFGGDAATVEAKYKAQFGNQFPSGFTPEFGKFLIEVNPLLKDYETVLKSLDGQFLLVSMFGSPTRLETTSEPAYRSQLGLVFEGSTEGRGLITNVGRILEESDPATAEEIKARTKEFSDGFSAALGQARAMLIQGAGFYKVELTAAYPGDFPAPANYFGTAEVAAELKDILLKPLFYASFKDKSGAFTSFFELYFRDTGDSMLSRNIDIRLGRYNFLPAAENIYRTSGETGPSRSLDLTR